VTEVSILSNSGTLSAAVIEEIKADSFIQGSSNSNYLWIEYSDLQCPYCKELHRSQISQDIMQEVLSGNVDYTIKHYPKAFHTEALPAHQLLECLAAAQGQEAFYQAVDLIFASDEKLSPTLLQSVIRTLKGDEAALNACVEGGTYREKVFAHIGEAVGIFDAKYVPSTIIINTSNGKWMSYVGNEEKAKIVGELSSLEGEI
jgi:protein-disulfide isomerase